MPDNETFTAAAIPEEALDPISVPIGIFEYSESSVAAPYVQVKTGRDFVVVDDLYVGGGTEIAGNVSISGSALFSGVLTVTSSSDTVDVTGIAVVNFYTYTQALTIGGFSNGVEGQPIDFYVFSSAHDLVLKHNKPTVTQPIITPGAGDITFTTYGGGRMFFDGGYWRITSYSNS